MSPCEFRAKHAANPAPCYPDCPGWALFDEGTDREAICRCDACWYGYDDTVTDDDAAALPEAKWLSDAYGLELSA